MTEGSFYFHTPLITASDCEGAGQMFQVTTMNLYDLKKDENGSIVYDNDFFGKQASLTVSGQLEGELAATAFRTDLYIRSDFPCGKLQYAATPGRVLDDRAGSGFQRYSG